MFFLWHSNFRPDVFQEPCVVILHCYQWCPFCGPIPGMWEFVPKLRITSDPFQLMSSLFGGNVHMT